MSYDPDPEAFENALIEQSQGKPHHCPLEGCDAVFYRPYRLAHHLYLHANLLNPVEVNKERNHVCTVEGCSKSYFSKSHLDRHIKTTHASPEKDVIYSCPVCVKSFSNRQNLKRHMKVVHMERNWFRCEECNIDFRSKAQLSAHMYQHTGIKAFTCERCSLEFVTNYELKRHMRFHKERKCQLCHMEFDQWVQLKNHKKTMHAPPAQYICDTCGKSFRKRSHLVHHLNLHDPAGAFQCPFEECPRSYARRSSLKHHITINHMKVTHDCNMCGAKLSTKAKLNEHVVKIHLTEPKPRIVKTRATGRKPRKDKGIPKVSVALKLAGLKKLPRPRRPRPPKGSKGAKGAEPVETQKPTDTEAEKPELIEVEVDVHHETDNSTESQPTEQDPIKLEKSELIEVEVDLHHFHDE